MEFLSWFSIISIFLFTLLYVLGSWREMCAQPVAARVAFYSGLAVFLGACSLLTSDTLSALGGKADVTLAASGSTPGSLAKSTRTFVSEMASLTISGPENLGSRRPLDQARGESTYAVESGTNPLLVNGEDLERVFGQSVAAAGVEHDPYNRGECLACHSLSGTEGAASQAFFHTRAEE